MNDDDVKWLEYPFPLRENFTARLILPRDLTAVEAQRLAAMLAQLATPAAEDTSEANP